MSFVTASINWLGDRVVRALDIDIERRLHTAGSGVRTRAAMLAPKDTGALAASIDYRVVGKTLTIIIGQPYGVFQEFGTRHMRPHPFIRPALLEMRHVFGMEIELDFNRLGGGLWGGMFAHGGAFAIPSGRQHKPLTARQRAHVQQHLMPVSKRLHHGAVKRARMRVRRFE